MKLVQWIVISSLMLTLAACHQAVGVAPSLGPVNPAKQRTEGARKEVSACTTFLLHAIPSGGDPVAEATEDLRTTPGVDGFVGVTVEQATYFWLLGHTTCTTVSATPFTYQATRSTRKKAPKTPLRVPTPARTSTPVVECTLICERFGRIMETNQMLQRRATQRCNTRCARDRTFQECVTKASTSRAAKFCESAGR